MIYEKIKCRGEKKMKVFISWSGEVSFKVAKVLKEWIPCVIQDVQPYFSSEDIDKGARWSTDIAKELESASFGILCVTKENMDSKWLNFEAGALSKAIDKSKVCPLLFRLKPSDITDSPILQFQMANDKKDDIYKLLKSINNSLGENGLEEARLEKVFTRFWPEIEKNFKEISDSANNNKDDNMSNSTKEPEILEEMLELLRTQQMLLKSPEKIFPVSYFQKIMSMDRKDSVILTKDRIPTNIILNKLKKDEMDLLDIISDLPESSVNRELKKVVKDYIMNCNRIFSTIGIDNFHFYPIRFLDSENFDN